MKMVERFPPAWCASICTNSMNDKCIEDCAIKRDCSGFDPKNIKLEDMPRFPKTAGMTKEEKFAVVAVYLSKITDHLQGVENGDHFDYPASCRISKALQKQGILFSQAQRITPHPDREECESVGSGSDNLVAEEKEQP